MHLNSDKRFTVTREFCGYPQRRYVVRFCGEFVSQHASQSGALLRAASEASQRRTCAPIITEVKP